MRKTWSAAAMAVALFASSAATAAITHVSGSGVSYDPGIALEDALRRAFADRIGAGGEPIAEVYNHVTRANQWIASSVWSCELADAP
jgi:hypothetical protein